LRTFGKLHVLARQQHSQLSGVANAVIGVAVVHQDVHLIRSLGKVADRCDPALELVVAVEIAEAFGGGDVRLLVGLGVVAASGLVAATTGGVDERKPCGSSTTT
jgi:hypothetical protein